MDPNSVPLEDLSSLFPHPYTSPLLLALPGTLAPHLPHLACSPASFPGSLLRLLLLPKPGLGSPPALRSNPEGPRSPLTAQPLWCFTVTAGSRGSSLEGRQGRELCAGRAPTPGTWHETCRGDTRTGAGQLNT